MYMRRFKCTIYQINVIYLSIVESYGEANGGFSPDDKEAIELKENGVSNGVNTVDIQDESDSCKRKKKPVDQLSK